MSSQPTLLPMPEQSAPPARETPGPKVEPRAPRLKEPNRKQLVMDSFDLEKLIPADHPARGIWALVESLPTEGFLKENKSVEGHAGRPRTSPRMLLAIWVYGYSQGMGQAREIEREMVHEPALRWLAGNSLLSFRTLSDFRVAHGAALREAFCELLGILSKEKWIDLSELTLDGTKIKADASGSSRRQEKSLQEHIAQAAVAVQQLEQKETAEEIGKRKEAARKRAAEERQQRLQKASEELEQIRQKKKKDEERLKADVSLTDPEARVMKDGHGGFALSYNVQVLTETKNKIVVNVAVTQEASDQQQLEGALSRLQEEELALPERLIVDGGYRTKSNLEASQQQGVELIGPSLDLAERQARNCAQSLKRAGIAPEFGPAAFVVIEDGKALQCPAGKRLELKHTTDEYKQYESDRSDCAACAHQTKCSPKGQRHVKVGQSNAAEKAYVERMKDPESRARYKKRGPVAEFPHAWIKDKLRLRQFHVRGLVKVEIEVLWAALTYNMQQWVRLSWRPKLATA